MSERHTEKDAAAGDEFEIPRPGPSTMVVHFYRAVVAHADVWRQRMDATTNWAAATTAGMITFTFGAESPHFVLLLSLAFDTTFLVIESRRYQTYHLWRRRFQALNRYVVAPTLAAHRAPETDVLRAEFQDLASDLGRSAPYISLREAIGYRIQRNYGAIFAIVFLAWLMKLLTGPRAAVSTAELLDRAAVGPVGGVWIWAGVVTYLLGAIVLALTAPSERMVDWHPRAPALNRWLSRWRAEKRAEELDEIEGPPS